MNENKGNGTALKTRSRIPAFLRAKTASELERTAERLAFHIWNALVLLLAPAVIALFCLRLGLGLFYNELFWDYFRLPLLLLLNYLPVLGFYLLLYCLFNRHWAACLGTEILFVTSALGDFYKIKFRGEPFQFSDFGAIGAAMDVAGSYDLTPNRRILVVLTGSVLLVLGLALLARGRWRRPTRLIAGVLVLLSIVPLGRSVYFNTEIYESPAATSEHLIIGWDQQKQISKGFVYHFLYSISGSSLRMPEGYDEGEAAALLAPYADADIPQDRKVNLMVLQLESYADLNELGISGIDPTVYAPLARLQEESLSGWMVSNVFAGGTVNSERCFLTGSMDLLEYMGHGDSYVWYLDGQGYATMGSHPNNRGTYNRSNVNQYLGFQDYRYADFYEEQMSAMDYPWLTDPMLLPAATRQFLDSIHSGKPSFSFNVTMQGHSPYSQSCYGRFTDELWTGEGLSQKSREQLNRYLCSVRETGEMVWQTVEELRGEEAPVVLLLYGDHLPGLGEANSVYDELGVNFDRSTEQGFLNYYRTPYLIWANDAARELLGSELRGEAPMVSPSYLMSVLFDALGWQGSAWMQFTRSIREELPVLHAKNYYYENGSFTASLSQAGEKLRHDYACAQYYLYTKS